jgi:hypothetical protein
MKHFSKTALAVVMAFLMFTTTFAQNRSISNGDVTVDPASYTAGSTMDLYFTWSTFESQGAEWVDSTRLIFPVGVTINSAENMVNPLGTDSLVYNVEASTSQMAVWKHSDLYGLAPSSFPVTNIVNVTIDPGFNGILTVDYGVFGDGYGAEPHFYEGTIEMVVDNEPDNAAVAIGAGATGITPYFTVSWDSAPNGADNYKVYRDAGEGFEEIATLDLLAYDDYAIAEGVDYTYAVSAVLDGEESLKSETESISFIAEGTLSMDPNEYTFPLVNILEDGTNLNPAAPKDFTITNVGLNPLAINDIYLFSQNANEFEVLGFIDPVVLNYGETFTFDITFLPVSPGPKATLLTVDAGVISTYNIYGGAQLVPEGDILEDPIALGIFSEPIGSIAVEAVDFSEFNDDYSEVSGIDGVFTLATIEPLDVTITDAINLNDYEFYSADAGIASGNELDLTTELPAGDYIILVSGHDEVSFNINFQSDGEYLMSPEALDLGWVPVNCWHSGGSFVISNEGGSPFTVDSYQISDLNNVYEVKVTPEESPVIVEWDAEVEYNFHSDASTEGVYEAHLIIEHNGEVKVYPVTSTSYIPMQGDVFEDPFNVAFTNGDFTVAGVMNDSKNNYGGLGATTSDVVYRFEYTTDVLVDFSFTTGFGFDLYRAEDLMNTAPPFVTPILTEADAITEDSAIHDVTLTAGVYYIILTGAPDAAYDLSITGEDLPVPADFALLTPTDEATAVSINPTLSWEESINAVSYNLYIGTTYPPALYAEGLTATEFTVEVDLMPANVYFWYVEGVNTQGVTTTDTWGFTTELPAPKKVTATIQDFTDVLVAWQNPFETIVNVTEDFEGDTFPPAGWTKSSNSTASTGGWTASEDNGSENFDIPGHTIYASTNDDAAGDDGSVDYLMMPETDFSAYDEVVLNFSTFFPGTFNQTAHVLITNDNGESIVEVAEIDAAGSWHDVSIDLSEYATTDYNTARIIFHSNDNSGSGSGWAIDDVELELINNFGAGGAVLGYNVYSNGDLVNTDELVEDLSILVEDLSAGMYTYCVSAVYPEGESAQACAELVEILGRSDISGTVYNADGGVLQGATLTIEGESVGVLTTESSADGTYTFNNIPVLTGGYDITCEASGWSSAEITGLLPEEGSPVVQDFHLSDIPYAVGEVIAEVVTIDESNHIYWTEPVAGEALELSQYDGEAANAYYQSWDKAYGVVYDLEDYSDATLTMVDFYHASYGVSGIWEFKIHVVNWDTFEEIAELGPFQTTGDDKWEVEIPLGDIVGLGGANVGILMEPMGNAVDDAYPDLSSDNNNMDGLSVVCDVDGWSAYSESTIGDFLMDLWILTAEGSAPVLAKKIELNGANETLNTRVPSNTVHGDFSIFSQNVVTHSNDDAKSFQQYAVYVLSVGEEGNPASWTSVAYTNEMEIIDDVVWPMLDQGVYRYAVVTEYTLNQSAPVFSNIVGKDMLFELMVLVSTNTGQSAEGAVVNVLNSYGDNYQASVNEIGSAHFSDPLIRKGEITITVSMECYDDAVWTGVVWDDDYLIVELVLEESVTPVINASATVQCSDVTLNWEPGSDCDNILSYSIARNGIILVEDYTETTYFDGDLPGGSYTYEIVTNYLSGHSDAVDVVAEVEALLAPTNITATIESWNNIVVSWELLDPDYISTTLSWCGDNVDSGIGVGEESDFDVASRWTPVYLNAVDGAYLTKVQFFPMETNCEYYIRVWSGENATNLLVDQLVVEPEIGEWNTVILDNPVLIDASEELWFGYRVDTQTGYPAGTDDGPAVAGLGNMIFWNGEWIELTDLNPSLSYNWAIVGTVESETEGEVALTPIEDMDRPLNTVEFSSLAVENSPIRESEELIGFRIERTNILTGEHLVLVEYHQSMFYVDFDYPVQPGGGFIYVITAIYSGGCEVPGNPIEVLFIDVNDFTEETINVYPNPATDVVNIELPANTESVKVLNAVGQVVYSNKVFNHDVLAIDAKSFANGAYFIQIVKTNGDILNTKVVVTR